MLRVTGADADASAGSENPDTIIQTQNTDVSSVPTDNGRDTEHINRKKSHTTEDGSSAEVPPDASPAAQTRSEVTDSCRSVSPNRKTEEQKPSYTAALECEHIVLQHSLPPPYIQPPPHPLNDTWASARSDSTDPTTSRPPESLSSRRFSRPSSAGQGNDDITLIKTKGDVMNIHSMKLIY